MNQVHFCYEVSELAGMAHTEDGDNAKAYVKMSMEPKNPIEAEAYAKLHSETVKRLLSNQIGVDGDLLSPITYEQYLIDADDE